MATDSSHNEEVQSTSCNRIKFLSLPFEIRHRIYQMTFEPVGEGGPGCTTVLRLNKIIFGEAQAHLHGRLNANVLSIVGKRYYEELPFEAPVTFGRSGTWRFDKYSRLEACLLPRIILSVTYSDLILSPSSSLTQWPDSNRESQQGVKLSGDVSGLSERERLDVTGCRTKKSHSEVTKAQLERPLCDYYLGRQIDTFCDMAKESTCLAHLDIYLHCFSSNEFSDTAIKAKVMHAFAPMKKLMRLVHLSTAIAIEAKPWNGTLGLRGPQRGVWCE